MSSAASLTEPQVLAHAKRRLFPDPERDGTYAVVDTQFSSDYWLEGQRVEEAVRETLSPFNHVEVGSGYPDLVGVVSPDDELLGVSRVGDDPPLVVVEAKGYTERGVDVSRGIVQAHDRLGEANVAFVAAPGGEISESNRTLARELNVGVLGVETEGAVEPLELPRVVGNRTTSEADAIRFQASAQGVADKSFGLNHPKNYLAYPLALYHPEDTERLLGDRVVRAVADARKGAAFLDLVDARPDGTHLRPLGREVVRFALREYGSVESALAAFDDWKRSQKRFCDLAPRWGLLTRRVVFSYPATKLLVKRLQQMHDHGIDLPSLPDLVAYLHRLHPTFAVELFVRGSDDVRGRVLSADGDLQTEALEDGNVFHSPTVFQLKAILYHAGILTERGAEPSNLVPEEDVWELRERL